MSARAACALSFSLAFAGALLASCASIPDTTRVTTVLTPDYASFAGDATNAGVHTFLENRCGTLDCHGQVGRAFRLFSRYGLRPGDSGLVTGGQPDTIEEIYSNYVSAVGLQPEELSRVVAGDDPPTDLLLVTKPTAMETHKGGAVISVGDDAYTCLTSWLSERTANAAACNAAAMVP